MGLGKGPDVALRQAEIAERAQAEFELGQEVVARRPGRRPRLGKTLQRLAPQTAPGAQIIGEAILLKCLQSVLLDEV
jgi:hypothetical protein